MNEPGHQPLHRRSELHVIAADSVDAGQRGIAAARSGSRRREKRLPGTQWARLLRYLHGLYPEQWQAMLLEQGGLCYLCQRPLPEDRRRIVIDHDHDCCRPVTARASSRSCGYCRRGLACASCNTGIGAFGDDPQLLRLAADNLERAQATVQALRLTKPEQGELLSQEA